MTTYLQHACLVALIGFQMSTCGKGPKFFTIPPSSNKLRCNCKSGLQCGLSGGKCPNDRCFSRFVGPNCQHWDISEAFFTPPKIHPDIMDYDDRTCVKQFSGNATLETLKVIHFFWVYISANSEIAINPKIVLFNVNKGIYTKNQFYILKLSKRSLLIKSHKDVMFNILELSDLPEDVCTLEVGIGRNLALFAEITPANLRNLVDGSEYTASAYQGKTAFEITLPHEARVNMVIVSHTAGARYKFTVDLTTPHGYLISFKDVSSDKAVVRFSRVVRNVSIVLDYPYGTVWFDEVYIVGEFHCPKDWYGPHCDRHCPVGCSREKCDPDWGCAEGCDNNRTGIWCEECSWAYGPDCQSACADGCAGEGKCDIHNGICLLGCKLGYIPPLCNTTCPPGTYDLNCSKTCVQCMKNQTTQKHACDPTSGECLIGCGLRYGGEFCESLIVKDDLASKITSISIGGFIFLALVLLYRQYTRGEEECSEEVGRNRQTHDPGEVNEVEDVKELDDALQRDTTTPHGSVTALWGALLEHVEELDVQEPVNVFKHRADASETEPRGDEEEEEEKEEEEEEEEKEEEEDKYAHTPRTPFWHRIFGPRETRTESEQSVRSIQEAVNGAQPASAEPGTKGQMLQMPEKGDLDEALKDDVSTVSTITESSVDEVVTGPVIH